MMAAAKTASRNLAAEVTFLTRALKAPSLREAAGRLAERARAENWSHGEILVACLQREVSARESHGGEGRIRAARLPAPKSLALLALKGYAWDERASHDQDRYVFPGQA